MVRQTLANIRLYRSTVLVFGMCIALSAIALFEVENRSRIVAENNFHKIARQYLSSIQDNFSAKITVIKSIAALFERSGRVTRNEFQKFVANVSSSPRAFQSFEWIPRVPGSKRQHYEAMARREGFPKFQFTERSSQGNLVRAGERNTYFPIYFMVPYKGNERVLGFDLASDPTRRAALEMSRDTGNIEATSKLHLIQLQRHGIGIRIVVPIYGIAKPHGTIEERRRNLAGYAAGVIHFSRLFSLRKEASVPFAVYVYQTQEIEEGLWENQSPLDVYSSALNNGTAPLLTFEEAATGPNASFVMPIGHQRLTLIAKPLREDFKNGLSSQGWYVLVASLVFTTLVTVLFYLSQARAHALANTAKDLREREARLSGIMDNVVDGIITIDARGRIESFNHAAALIFGYPAEQVRNRNVSMLMPEPDKSNHDGYIERYLETGEGKIIGIGPREVVGRRKDGETFPMGLAVSAMELGGETKFIGIVRDITQRKETERQLRQAQKMDAVGQLTGGVAHDFNNLLTAVIGNLQLLGDKVGNHDRTKRNLEFALHAAIRGADLTKQLLAFSRRQTLAPTLVNLNEIIPTTIQLLERTLGEDIEIKTVLAGGLWRTMVDQSLMENALLNLAVNARDAMADGGKLTIETANTHLDDAYARAHNDVAPGQYVMVAISDEGIGMSAETVERAVEPFFTTKGQGKGTGLGLSMVFGFVKQSGGHMKIYSVEGQGTSIKMYFPKADTDTDVRGERRTVSSLPMPEGTETILVVEDAPDVRAYVIEVLEAIGYEVLEAENGPAALRLLDEGAQIDLLFTDVVMPGGMSGRDVAEEVKKRCPNVKVVFTSGYAENSIIHHDRLDDGVELLAKPFTRESLAQKLRQVLDQ